jgi:hypothetical protein
VGVEFWSLNYCKYMLPRWMRQACLTAINLCIVSSTGPHCCVLVLFCNAQGRVVDVVDTFSMRCTVECFSIDAYALQGRSCHHPPASSPVLLR